MKTAHRPATTRSAGRRFGDRVRERLRISSWCLTSTDSATTARAPPGPASRATVARRWRNRTARSRMSPAYQDREIQEMLMNFAIRQPQAFRDAHAKLRALFQALEDQV